VRCKQGAPRHDAATQQWIQLWTVDVTDLHVMAMFVQKYFYLNLLKSLTFIVRMLDISNAAGTPYWPNVRYIERSACVTCFSTAYVLFSCKPMQTHWGARQNAWHSSGSITSFMAVLLLARMGEEGGVHRMLVGKLEGKRLLGRPRHRWEDNINTLRTGIFSSIFITNH
jgi:hypothetical protein